MTLRSVALVCAMIMAAPATAVAQMRSTTLMSGQVPVPRPSGTATSTTDRAGQTKLPSKAQNVKTPKQVPNWHIPLPHIHHRG